MLRRYVPRSSSAPGPRRPPPVPVSPVPKSAQPMSSEMEPTSAVVEMTTSVTVRATAAYDASAEGEEAEADPPAESLKEDARRRASIAVMEMAQREVSFVRPSTFRAGVLQMMLSGRPMAETAGMGAVTKISGDVRATFDQIDENGNGVIDTEELLSLLLRCCKRGGWAGASACSARAAIGEGGAS